MIKTPQDRSDRTYSVPSAPGNLNNPQQSSFNNNPNHGYMLPLSPGGPNGNNSITPKTTTHANMQRQSINEGLVERNAQVGMIQSQNGNGQSPNSN
jgi:hypothetical protein